MWVFSPSARDQGDADRTRLHVGSGRDRVQERMSRVSMGLAWGTARMGRGLLRPSPSTKGVWMTLETYREEIRGEQDCPICGWSKHTINTETHHKRCRNWQKACDTLGYQPMVRVEARETMDEVRDVIDDVETNADRFEANIKLGRAMYDRSLGLAIDNRNHEEHPTFNEYIAMLDVPEFGELLRERFPYNEGHIAPGFTVWEPPGSKDRKMQFRMSNRH